VDNIEELEEPRPKRKLFADQTEWQRNKMKIQRMHGKSYIGFHKEGNRTVQGPIWNERSMKATCNSSYCKKSKLRHCNIFNESERLSIFQHFWKCTWEEKKLFALIWYQKMRKKRATEALGDRSRRNFSFVYHLKSNFDSYVVCKTMFLNTLGINELMVHNWLAFSNNGLPVKNTVLKKSLVGDED